MHVDVTGGPLGHAKGATRHGRQTVAVEVDGGSDERVTVATHGPHRRRRADAARVRRRATVVQ